MSDRQITVVGVLAGSLTVGGVFGWWVYRNFYNFEIVISDTDSWLERPQGG